MKYCIIRRVPFRWPGKKSRIVWANVLCEREGLVLVHVPKSDMERPHSIFIAEENIIDRVFESVGPHRFDLETEDLTEAGDKLRMLGKSFSNAEFLRRFRFDDYGTSDL
jgi:hypothetical protein